MQATCPKCAGTFETERGGLQFCPSCGQQITVHAIATASSPDAAAASAGAAPPSGAGAPAGGGGPPWERRRELGFFPALFETWKQSMFNPEPFFRSVDPRGPWVDALIYGWLVWVARSLLTLPFALLQGGSGEALREMAEQSRFSPQLRERVREQVERFSELGDGALTIGSVSLFLISFPLVLLVTASVIHLFCLVLGASRNGFNATFRGLAYAQSATVLAAVPFVGGVIAFVYTLVLETFAVRALQQTTTGKAVASVILPLVFFCVCCCGIVGLGFAGILGLAMQKQ